jgi:hypothetical protein
MKPCVTHRGDKKKRKELEQKKMNHSFSFLFTLLPYFFVSGMSINRIQVALRKPYKALFTWYCNPSKATMGDLACFLCLALQLDPEGDFDFVKPRSETLPLNEPLEFRHGGNFFTLILTPFGECGPVWRDKYCLLYRGKHLTVSADIEDSVGELEDEAARVLKLPRGSVKLWGDQLTRLARELPLRTLEAQIGSERNPIMVTSSWIQQLALPFTKQEVVRGRESSMLLMY